MCHDLRTVAQHQMQQHWSVFKATWKYVSSVCRQLEPMRSCKKWHKPGRTSSLEHDGGGCSDSGSGGGFGWVVVLTER